MSFLIVCGNDNVGGTGTVISKLKKLIVSDIYFLKSGLISNIAILKYSKAKTIIAIQPKAIFNLLIFSLINRDKKLVFIFDAHPLGFGSNLKQLIASTIPYYLFALFAHCFILRKYLIIPDGPLKKMYPYKYFTICSWDEFIEPKFVNADFKNSCDDSIESLLFYGTPSEEKCFNNFVKLAKKNNFLNFKVVGYKTKILESHSNILNYYGAYNGNNININYDILIWTSKFESFGLSYREYLCSGGGLLFLRNILSTDQVKNGVYLNLKNKMYPKSVISYILGSYRQSILLSVNTGLSSYLKNELY